MRTKNGRERRFKSGIFSLLWNWEPVRLCPNHNYPTECTRNDDHGHQGHDLEGSAL